MGIGDAMKMALEVIKTASSNHILDPSKTYLTANVFLCKYFHQLQQILRLCGYNELANTLKLK